MNDGNGDGSEELIAAAGYALDMLDQNAGGETVASRLTGVGGQYAARLLRDALASAGDVRAGPRIASVRAESKGLEIEVVAVTPAMLAAGAMLAMLKRLERTVAIGQFWTFCPCCRGVSREDGGRGHVEGCELVALIAKAGVGSGVGR